MNTSIFGFEHDLNGGRVWEEIHGRSAAPGAVHVRFLRQEDLPGLMVLEHEVWASNQAASASDLLGRISRYPELAIGAFCGKSGKALASLFAKPTHRDAVRHAGNWRECVSGSLPYGSRSASALFGISLSSVNAEAAKAIFEFFWPYALKNGWREMFLGSPVPGLREWMQKNPEKPVEDYVYSKRNGLPCDPQLRYYHQKGFQRIVAVRPDYFPHDASMNYGVILGGRIPLSVLSPLWQRMPLKRLMAMRKWLFVLR